MRTKAPATSIYFLVKKPCAGCAGGGGGTEKTDQFVCIIKCKQNVGEHFFSHDIFPRHIALAALSYDVCSVFEHYY